jgi:drug/metabolite transporter (DMT)-like permease
MFKKGALFAGLILLNVQTIQGITTSSQIRKVGRSAVKGSAAPQASQNLSTVEYLESPASELVFDGSLKMYANYHLVSQKGQLIEQIPAKETISNARFFMKTGSLIFVAFGLIFLYGQWQDVIAERTGLKLSHICCIIYAALSISIDLSIKNAAAAYGGSFPFNPGCGVVVVEYTKLVASAILFAVHVKEVKARGDAIQLPMLKDVAWLAVPGAIYATNNLIVFEAIKSTPLATFGVIRETMLIWNALIWTATFRQPIGFSRWLAIFGIFFGCSVNQIPKMLNDEFTFGVGWACLLAFTNAAGAVANEYAMKQKAAIDINLQNAFMYAFCGSFVFIGMAIFNPQVVSSRRAFFTGFVPECWTIIVLQVITGLAVSRILKYVEAVTKTIVAAVRGPGVIFLGALIFHTQLRSSEVFATLCVCVACWWYLREGPLVQPKATPEVSHAPLKASSEK